MAPISGLLVRTEVYTKMAILRLSNRVRVPPPPVAEAGGHGGVGPGGLCWSPQLLRQTAISIWLMEGFLDLQSFRLGVNIKGQASESLMATQPNPPRTDEMYRLLFSWL